VYPAGSNRTVGGTQGLLRLPEQNGWALVQWKRSADEGCQRTGLEGTTIWKLSETAILAGAAIPFIYYLLAIYSTIKFLRAASSTVYDSTFTPPVSCLKPVKGLDEDDYQNYASFCRQDYPEYEIVFCVDEGDAALPIIEKLILDFPERSIRILLGSGREALNDKVARLVRLSHEAKHDLFVISDNDVRVRPDYLRTVVSPFRDSKVGGGTCLYRSATEKSGVQLLQSVGMTSDFFAGIMVAWKLDGVKFAFGQTILARREAIESFGGYEALESRPADDLLVGRSIAEQGYEVVLLPYVVEAVPDFKSLEDLLLKRLRWMTVMRMMRPWGHFGLIFTWGLPWAVLAVGIGRTWPIAVFYFGGVAATRIFMTWLLGRHLLNCVLTWKKMILIPVWDLTAFGIWLVSFSRSTIKWRGINYSIRNGLLEEVSRKS
jgi:ceramide glucosyltransferase